MKLLPIFFVILAIALLVLFSGCVTPPDDTDGQTGKCGDGICGPVEKEEGTCPEDCNSITPLKQAYVLDVPLPENSKCFWFKNSSLAECAVFYEGISGRSSPSCPTFVNPVYDSNGIFYPSACWAERLGATEYTYGYSPRMLQFFSDLWRLPEDGNSDVVPHPNIEFTYSGSGFVGSNSGTYMRSTLWLGKNDFDVVDFDISRESKCDYCSSRYSRNTLFPVYESAPKAILVFVMFDEAYPESTLLDWTDKYEYYLNDYLAKKQLVPSPISYDLVPVVISPPVGVSRPTTDHIYFSEDELHKIYDAGTAKLGQSSFQILIVSPVVINGFGGYYTFWNDLELIDAPLSPPAPYSETDKKAGLDSLAAFQESFVTISHEILHAVGLLGDHMPMENGTTYLDIVGQAVNHLTGKPKPQVLDCDFLGQSPDYYAVELPPEMKINVGQEPSFVYKTESASGPCLTGLHNNDLLKDYDMDGEYEIMYKNNLIGIELQRSLGWEDVDGDSVSELVDQNPYGGYSKKNVVLELTRDNIVGGFYFEPIEQVSFNGCYFEKVQLKKGPLDGVEPPFTFGLVPLQCQEFDDYAVNIYKKVKYFWIKIDKEYGTVIVPMRGAILTRDAYS